MTCGAMFAQNRGDMYVGGILGVSGGSSKTSVTVGSTTMKGDSTPSDTEFNLTGEFGYFFADNWRVSGSLGYELVSSPTNKKDGKWLKDNVPASPRIREVRGRGLMLGIQFNEPVAQIRKSLLFDHHIFTGVAGTDMVRIGRAHV